MAGLVSAGSALLLLMALSTATEAYDLNRCYCVSEFDETLRAKIAAFDPPPSPPANQYVGVEPKAADVFQSCFCQDVTRVQLVVSVTSSDWVTLAAVAENQVTLANNISATLRSYLPTLRTVPELQYTLDRFSSVTYKDTTNTEVNFNVEVLLRGHRDQSVADKLMAAVRDELTKDDMTFKTDAMVPKLVSCASPPDALSNGQRSATAGNIASGTAVYTCKTGYRLSTAKDEEAISCGHDKTWTPLPAGLSCQKQPDCKDEPPAAPENAIHTWQPGIYPSGMSVAYTCKEAYSDAHNQMAMSKCNGGVWEATTPVLNCKHTGCLMSPPQVPDHGSINWNQQRGAGAKAVYGCIDGYKSDNGYYPQVSCVNKTWVGFPSEWRCIRNDAPLKEVVVPVDETELNYFFVVTIPSVGGLVLVIIFCLCCTRTDSPLFNICSTKVSKHYSKA